MVLTPDYSKRDYLLPSGCKDLIDVINLRNGKDALFLPSPSDQDVAILKAELVAALNKALVPPPIKGEILVSETTTVRELAKLLSQAPFKIVADLMQAGVFADLDQRLSFQAVSKVAWKYGYAAKKKS